MCSNKSKNGTINIQKYKVIIEVAHHNQAVNRLEGKIDGVDNLSGDFGIEEFERYDKCRIVISSSLFAQFQDFDLSSYKLPEIKRSQLDINFNLSDGNTFNWYHNETQPSGRNSLSNLSGVAQASYSFFRNNEKVQVVRNSAISLNPGFRRERYSDSTVFRTASLNTSFYFTGVHRLYRNERFFLEPDIRLTGNFYTGGNRDENQDTKTRSISFRVNVEIPLLACLGRIEPVQDARLALYILEDLNSRCAQFYYGK